MTPSRRSFLTGVAAIAAAAVSGCGGRGGAAATRTTPTPAADPSSVTATRTAAASPTAAGALPGIDLTAHSTTDPASSWVVVDKQRPLTPMTYAPDDLQSVGQGQVMRAPAAAAVLSMIAAAEAAGLELRADSGYRSYSYQQTVHAAAVVAHGEAAADVISARAGYSEHQTGWAVDLGTPGCDIVDCFATTPAGRWSAANAHRFGFLLRYRAGGEAETGFEYEPWHFRYVGPELAAAMWAAGSPYLETIFELPAAPTYP